MRYRHRNLRKAAILVASLGDEFARAIFAEMAPAQADALRKAVDALVDIDPTEQAEVIEEFFRIGPLVPAHDHSGIELDGQLPADLVIGRGDQDVRSDCQTHFRCLAEASAAELAPFLEREGPQTIAVVVSHLPSERAAEVLAGLSAELQVEVARRLVDLDETDPEILREVERGLEARLGQQVRGARRPTAGLSALVNILEASAPQLKQRIVAGLSPGDRQLAGKVPAPVPARMSFADLERLSDASLLAVLRHAAGELVVLALAGATSEFAQRAIELYPPAAQRALRAALCDLGPTRLSDVEEAQQELIEIARQLESRGEIALSAGGRLSVAA